MNSIEFKNCRRYNHRRNHFWEIRRISNNEKENKEYGEKIEFSEFNSPISETVNLSNENKTKKIRIYIIWNDNPDTSSMDNLSDTSSTLKADSSAILDVSVAFTQVAQ